MIISSKEAVILFDDKPTFKGFRLNLDHKSRKLRLKTSVYDYDGDNEVLIPMDIVVTNYSNIMFDLPSTISFNVIGKELNKNIDFNIKLSINLVKRSLSGIIGKIGKTTINCHALGKGEFTGLSGHPIKREDLSVRLLIDQFKEAVK